MKKSLVVIPTKNEKENIALMIKSILKNMPQATVMVVDDNSKDKTADEVRKFSKDKRVKLIVRKGRKGRGGAVLDGFRWGYLKGNFDYFFEMDADFSHNPEDLPKILEKINSGADVVIGSRYLPTSKILNWGVKRTIFSKYANIYARFILKVPINDFTNGYRAYTREVVGDFLFRKMLTSGYIVLSEFIYIAHLKGKKIDQIPIIFVNRTRGESNLTLREIMHAVYGVLKLRFKRKELISKI